MIKYIEMPLIILNANFRSKLNNPHVGSGVRWRICCENIKIFCMKVLSFAMFANLCNNAAVCFASAFIISQTNKFAKERPMKSETHNMECKNSTKGMSTDSIKTLNAMNKQRIM
uniref:Gustatory receptor 19 n=1 Tax=Propsilocerus akamusi TaxID=903466 RepID=A0A7D0TCW5_9DIPT|nr:gustatory receptor 19 [Propsilocerus akamusi]